MKDCDEFAAAAMTGLLCNGDFSMESIPGYAFSMADAMLRERDRTNLDAVPEARARTDADSDRTDKAVLRPGEGTGNTPKDAEPAASGNAVTLTDAEREAVELFATLEWTSMRWSKVEKNSATLRKLLERTK